MRDWLSLTLMFNKTFVIIANIAYTWIRQKTFQVTHIVSLSNWKQTVWLFCIPMNLIHVFFLALSSDYCAEFLESSMHVTGSDLARGIKHWPWVCWILTYFETNKRWHWQKYCHLQSCILWELQIVVC